ncbi:MAG: 30S ribosomal protein S19 [Planctomycetes bacterium]|nr:30S ribosomal protein S19 [Planctomycetota bacterium]
MKEEKRPFVEAKLLKKVLKQKDSGDRKPIRTWSRSSTIIPEFVNHTFEVHNGKNFIKVFVSEDMIGHKIGEFSPTRIFRGHPGDRIEEAGTSAPTTTV